jgi:hypothetical protein
MWIRGWKVHNTFFSFFSLLFFIFPFILFFPSHYSIFPIPHLHRPRTALSVPKPTPAGRRTNSLAGALPSRLWSRRHWASLTPPSSSPLPGPRRQPWRQPGWSSRGGHGSSPVEASGATMEAARAKLALHRPSTHLPPSDRAPLTLAARPWCSTCRRTPTSLAGILLSHTSVASLLCQLLELPALVVVRWGTRGAEWHFARSNAELQGQFGNLKGGVRRSQGGHVFRLQCSFAALESKYPGRVSWSCFSLPFGSDPCQRDPYTTSYVLDIWWVQNM